MTQQSVVKEKKMVVEANEMKRNQQQVVNEEGRVDVLRGTPDEAYSTEYVCMLCGAYLSEKVAPTKQRVDQHYQLKHPHIR